jgi:hypothetical protein
LVLLLRRLLPIELRLLLLLLLLPRWRLLLLLLLLITPSRCTCCCCWHASCLRCQASSHCLSSSNRLLRRT